MRNLVYNVKYAVVPINFSQLATILGYIFRLEKHSCL
jgi:hypothetical protein